MPLPSSDSQSSPQQKAPHHVGMSHHADVRTDSAGRITTLGKLQERFTEIIPGIGKKIRVRVFFALAVLVPIFGYMLFSRKGIVPRIGLELDKKDLLARIAYDKRQQDSLIFLLKRLEQDTFFMEKIAREQYGMMKPGEKVFLLETVKK